jgi:hypothetical protein
MKAPHPSKKTLKKSVDDATTPANMLAAKSRNKSKKKQSVLYSLKKEPNMRDQLSKERSSEEKKGFTTALLEFSKAAPKVPAPESDGVNARAHFLPDRARPECIRESLERIFTPSLR